MKNSITFPYPVESTISAKTSSFERDLDRILAPLNAEEDERLNKLKLRLASHLSTLSSLLYEALPEEDQIRFVLWFAKRWAGINRVPSEELAAYLTEVARVRSHPYRQESLDGKMYKRLELSVQGYRGELLTYPWTLGIHDFFYNQYEHGDCRIAPGDTIIDAGAFVGDTALLFHQLTDGNCQIHAFEVLEENIKLLNHNLFTNSIGDKVKLCFRALANKSGKTVHIKATPIQGATSIFGDTQGAKIETITLDDYVKEKRVERVDFIKMDIEGAERMALAGALDTIRRDQPRLAICLYHLWDDAIEIPLIIKSSGVSYRFRFKWVELINGWEGVLLCTPETNHRTNS